MKSVDVIFKTAILGMVILFLFFFNQMVNNQRYSYQYTEGRYIVLDSRTGTIFHHGMPFQGKNYILKISLNGETEMIEIKPVK
jgi:hypothetical protein